MNLNFYRSYSSDCSSSLYNKEKIDFNKFSWYTSAYTYIYCSLMDHYIILSLLSSFSAPDYLLIEVKK